MSSNGRASVFQTEDVGSLPAIRSSLRYSSSGKDRTLPAFGRRFESVIPLQVRVSSDNGSTFRLHRKGQGSIPWRSTKCGRGRVVRRRIVNPSTRVQFSPVTPGAHRPTGEGTGFLNLRSAFESLWALQSFYGTGFSENRRSTNEGSARR